MPSFAELLDLWVGFEPDRCRRSPELATGSWTYGCSGMVCNADASLYCIEQ